nr:retrovirus-related Pol polyprotein from transposon TNT 1-94 [Tanacetum cinerariifolium]
MSTQQDIYVAGSESHPPMLNKENYVPWSSRLLRYAKSRPNGKLIHNSIINGPYTDDELTKKELKQIEADDQAIQTILLGLPEDIYAAVDSCEMAQEIWLRVQQMIKGSDIGIQEKKAKLFNEWERLTSNKGESIESYYHHFLKLMNDLKRNKHFPEKIASNLKFLNNLQPEWSRHVTIVHQTKNLHTADYTQLYDFLKYNQKEVDELKAKRLAKIQDPLALMANSNNPYAFPVPQQDQPSFNQNYMQQQMPNPEDITDPTTAMNMALVLMAKAFKLNYSTPTNNNQRISSNLRNRQIAQPGNLTGYNDDQNIGNRVIQNAVQNPRVQNIGNQNGLIGVPGNGNQNGNGNLVAARAEGNAAGQNGNQIRCYNCRGVGHYARNYTVRPRRRDAAYLQTQLLIAQKEEAGIQLQAEECDLMAVVADLDEIEKVNANYILMANLQQASPSEEQYTELLKPILDQHQVPQNNNNVISEVTSVEQSGETVEQHLVNFEETRALYDSLYQNLAIEVEKVNSKMAVGYQNPCYLKQAQKKQQSLYDGKVLLEKHDPPIVHDSEETPQLAQESREKMKQLNKEIKPANYTKINHLSGVFVSQTAKSREELYFSNDSKTANVLKSISIPNEEFSDDNTLSVARKFLNEVKSTIVTLQRVVKHRMTLETHNWSSSAHQELHKIVKDEFFPIVDFISLANEADESLVKHKALELEIKRLLKAVVSQDIISVVQKESVVDTSDLQTELEHTHNPLFQKLESKNVELEFQVSDQKDNTHDTSVNTKFTKQPIVEDLPKIGESHALSKPVTSNSVSTPQEPKVVKNDKVIALGMFRINPLKTFREEKHVPNTVRASTRIEPITVSQPHVFTKKDVNSNLNGLSSTGVDNTKTRRPQPSSNTKNDRVSSASKSSRSKNKEAEVKEHHWNLLLSKNNKHISSACNNINIDSQDVISKIVCAMCKQCLISVNHDVCLRSYVNGKKSRGKKKKAKVSFKENQKKYQPKKVGFLEILATPKPKKPRFLLRWSPTGRLFDQQGKIVNFSKSERQSDYSNGDNACTSNTLEPKIKRFPNYTSLLGRVYFIEGLGHNLFSVGQFCDSDLDVAFRRNACFVRNFEGVYLLKGNCSTNLYTINLHKMASASPICLMARASSTKSWLWHQRLFHLNFDTINDLPRNDLVSGLPKFKYHKEHLCPSCEQGKSKRASHPPKPVPNSRQRLNFLHLDLCGPMRIASINGKRIYNQRTKKIMETMNVSFDELSAMAFKQHSSKLRLQSMTSGQISSGLDLTYASSTITTQQPTEGKLDLLFEAMYDDFIGGQPSATARTVSPAQEPQVRQTSTAS